MVRVPFIKTGHRGGVALHRTVSSITCLASLFFFSRHLFVNYRFLEAFFSDRPHDMQIASIFMVAAATACCSTLGASLAMKQPVLCWESIADIFVPKLLLLRLDLQSEDKGMIILSALTPQMVLAKSVMSVARVMLETTTRITEGGTAGTAGNGKRGSQTGEGGCAGRSTKVKAPTSGDLHGPGGGGGGRRSPRGSEHYRVQDARPTQPSPEGRVAPVTR